MEDFTQIVKNALEYYDDNNLKYYDKINSFKYYNVDAKNGKITFYNNKKDVIFAAKYEYIGKYLHNSHIWIWGWSISDLLKEQLNTCLKLFNYAIALGRENISLKSELIISHYQITSPIQTDIHVALASYLAKKPFIFKLNTSNLINLDNLNENIFKIKHKPEDIDTSYYLILSNE